MNNLDTPPPLADWITLSKQLVDGIAQFIHVAISSTGDATLKSDFCKLREAAIRFDTFRQSRVGNNQALDSKTKHDLRNFVATIIGYCELILDDLPADYNQATKTDLRKILNQCYQLLEQDGGAKSNTRSQLPSALKTATGTILIVDDQKESREILLRQLQKSQYVIKEAANGKEMFQQLEQDNIDLILLDLILPEMDGFELLQTLKKNKIWRAIPIIVVSGNKDTEKVINCIEAGAEDFLFKPSNPILLHARISAGVERKRWHDKEQLYREELERSQLFIRNVFGRYLSEEIVSTLLEKPKGLELGGVQTKVSILMADISGFTPIAEQLAPQHVMRLLNNYLGAMTDIIMKYNGTIDEFIGDAILAIFGAPLSREDDSDRAILCALEMQTAMENINKRNIEEGLPVIKMGASIHTGQVIAGNIGSEKRAKYGIVGHTVNQVSRIEERCSAGKILISESTLKDTKLSISTGEGKTIKAKGILKAIKIFELNGINNTKQVN
jgi:class 3 adenylate cyclase